MSRTTGSAIGGQDADSRTGSHLEGLMTLAWLVELSLGDLWFRRCEPRNNSGCGFRKVGICVSLSEPIIRGDS